jgi:hypothetical protein
MLLPSAVDRELTQTIRSHVDTSALENDVHAARRDFAYLGFAKVSFLLPTEMKGLVAGEVERLFESHGTRRDLRFKETGYTPRRMRNIRRAEVFRSSDLIPSIYGLGILRDLLSDVVAEPVHLCPYEPEQCVITRLESEGDTHGWHWDDYSFALVWVIECPPVEAGGFVQCVPRSTWDKGNPQINRQFVSGPIYSIELVPGDLYVMRTDTTLHRVYPIQQGRRTIVNMGYASSADLDRPMTHETMDALWAGTN